MKASDEIAKAADHEFAKTIAAVQGLYRRNPAEAGRLGSPAPPTRCEAKIEQELT